MKKVIIVFSLFLAVFIKNFANETKVDTLKVPRKVYILDGITVIAERPEESIGNIDVKTFNPSKPVPDVNIEEALDNVAGMDLSVGGKNGSSLSIRGFNENEIKILLNGRPLSNGYMDAVDLTTIPMTSIGEIQVLKGPISSLYGSNTMGGVINIITKEPLKKRTVLLGAQIRRNNTNNFYVNVSQDVNSFDYSLLMSRFHSDGRVLSKKFVPTNYEDGSVKEHDGKTRYNFDGKINLKLYNFHKIGLQFSYSNMPLKEVTSSIYENNFSKFLQWNKIQSSLSGYFQLRYNLNYNMNLYFDRIADTYAQYSDPNYQNMDSTWPSYLQSKTLGADNKINWELNDKDELTTGIRYETLSYNRKDNGYYLDWTSNNTNQLNYYLQNKMNFSKMNITCGGGISWFRLNNEGNWKSHIEPSAGIYYSPNKSVKISFASAINTHYPTLRQLYSHTHGNKDLREESAWKSELTVSKNFVFGVYSGKWEMSVFYNKISDLIERVGEINRNIQRVQSYGFETIGMMKLGWEHQIEFSHIKYTKNSDIDLTGNPSYKFSLIESATLPFDVKISYKVLWKDKRIFLKSENSEVILPSYWLHSIFLNKKMGKFKFGFGITNLFDTNYDDEYGYPGEGINYKIIIERTL